MPVQFSNLKGSHKNIFIDALCRLWICLSSFKTTPDALFRALFCVIIIFYLFMFFLYTFEINTTIIIILI